MGDWNTILDLNIEQGERSGLVTNKLDKKYVQEFIGRLNLIDKFRGKHPMENRQVEAPLVSFLATLTEH